MAQWGCHVVLGLSQAQPAAPPLWAPAAEEEASELQIDGRSVESREGLTNLTNLTNLT